MNETKATPPAGHTANESERAVAAQDMVWTRIYYGREVMERILDTIQVKQALRQRFVLRYAARAAMAGVIVCLMYVFTYQIKTDLGPEFNVGLAKYLTALSFSVALVFIYFTNSELLTSNFMYFTVGQYYGKVKWAGALKIWSICLVGNLAGIAIVAAAVCSSGMLSEKFVGHLLHTVEEKTIASHGWEILVQGIFCNYFINISVIIAMQVKEGLAKIVVLMMGVTIFAYLGLEHVVANSALFIMALFERPEAVDLLHTGKNFLLSLVGNYVGGGLVIGLFYAYLNDHRSNQVQTKPVE
jgi:formate/nitrite transporter